MPIYLVGKTWYLNISPPEGERIRRSTGTTNRKEAQRIHDELKAELWHRKEQGKFWSDAVIAWLGVCERGVSDRYRIRSLGYADRPLSEITPQSFNLEGKKAANYQRYRNLIVAILNHARQLGWITETPKFPSRKTPPSRTRWLTQAEWQRLYQELPPHLKPLALFAVSTGLRQHNVTHLEWAQVDLKRKVAWVHADQAKAGKAIGVPLSDDAVAVLTAQQGQHERWVFPYRGKPIEKIKTAWQLAMERAGLGRFERTLDANGKPTKEWIGDFTWHGLRHTWASWHIMNGTPVEVLQKLGGWSDIRMVLRYAHLAPEYLAGYSNNYVTVSVTPTQISA